jgi:hypothetical protein
MMQVAEAVQHMTKAYLHRIIDSFTKDISKPDEDRSRDLVVRNADELTDPQRIKTALSRDGLFSDQLLQAYTLEALINRPDRRAAEEPLIEEVRGLEEQVLEEAASPEAFRYAAPKSIEVLRAVLEVALEDEQITSDELNLISRLREKLGLHEKTKQLLLAQLDHFPRKGNLVHTPSDFRDVLIDLQRRGIVFYCNKLEGGCYVIPEEIVPGVKAVLGIEMTKVGWGKLLDHMTTAQLATILDAAGLPKSGKKADLHERVRAAGLSPRRSLEELSTEDLYAMLNSLPGAKVSGSKAQRVDRIIDYFDRMVFRDVPAEAPPGELYYQYLVELACRDREILLANKVIRKDREMEGSFEEGTRYLFCNKLGLDLIHMEGSDHCDGTIPIGRRGDILMWDNKSKETTYTLPPSHFNQFKRYIRDSPTRVACFLIIVPGVDESAAHMAAKLKIESGTDTDVALITAEDLKWVAEQWLSRGNGETFNPEVFNTTGILDRRTLEGRMRLFL